MLKTYKKINRSGRALLQVISCLVPVRLSPRASRSIRFVSLFRSDHVIPNGLTEMKDRGLGTRQNANGAKRGKTRVSEAALVEKVARILLTNHSS